MTTVREVKHVTDCGQKEKKKTEQDRTTKAGEGTDQTGEEEKTGEISESKSSSFEYYITTTNAGAL